MISFLDGTEERGQKSSFSYTDQESKIVQSFSLERKTYLNTLKLS